MDLPDPGIEPGSPVLQADSLPTELSGKLKKQIKPLYKKKETLFELSGRGKQNIMVKNSGSRIRIMEFKS